MSEIAQYNHILAPGQGAQDGQWGQVLMEISSASGYIFSGGTNALHADKRASDGRPMNLWEICAGSTPEQVAPTRFTQLNLVGNSIAALAAFQDRHPGVRFHDGIGNSVGEFPIYYHAGVMSLEDTVCLVDARGAFMQELARDLVERGIEAGVAAARGLEAEEVISIVQEVNEENGGEENGFQAEVAGINTETQVTVSGYISELDLVGSAVKNAGGKFTTLKVAGPVHSRLHKLTETRLEAYIGTRPEVLTINNPREKTMISNRTGDFLENAHEVPAVISEHVTHTVQLWPSVQMAIGLRAGRYGTREMIKRAKAVHVLAEMGPGKTMANMYRPLEERYPGQVYVLNFDEAIATGMDVEAIKELRETA